MRLHVGAQDGVDAGLIAALAAEPAQQVGIETHGDRFFWRGQHHLGRFPECGVRTVPVGISGYPFADRSRRAAAQARPGGGGAYPRVLCKGGISECEHRKPLSFFLVAPLRCCHPTLAKCARVGHSSLALCDRDSENFHARKGNIEF
jgi:hypothetical protein